MFLLQCYWEIWVIFRHLEHSQKKPYKKGLQRFSSWFSFTFCPDFVDLYNKPVVKKVYRSWLRVQNKFLPNEGCLRMFSLLIKDPPSNPRPPTPPYIRYLACEQALPIWASEASLERTRERGASRIGRSLARFRETRFTRPNRRARSQAIRYSVNVRNFIVRNIHVSFNSWM